MTQPTADILTKVFTLTSLSFLLSLLLTPFWTKALYHYRLGKNIRVSKDTPIFSKLHAAKQGTPTMGGVTIWFVTAFIALLFWFLDRVFGLSSLHFLNFLTRKETLLPLGAFLGAALVGLADDILDIYRMGHNGRGLRFRVKIFLYGLVGAIGAWWFYTKLDFDTVMVPFVGNWHMGLWFIPFFIFVVISTSFAVNQADGLDGLAGGTLLLAFFSYGLIAFLQGNANLASFIGVISGAILAFLWYNINPARFFMGDTGSMGLGVALAVVAFLTQSVFLLPVIGFIFLLEAASTVIQMFSKKVFKRKVFLSAPIHHHFEAIGWPETKVTMRFWVVSAVSSLLGLIIYFIG